MNQVTKNNHPSENRATWVDTFMEIAFVMSRRSPDAETHHGCVITSEDNYIRSTGYNGFPQGVFHLGLPNTRPEKYLWMFHAERNAVVGGR